jgi:hypothetical protein
MAFIGMHYYYLYEHIIRLNKNPCAFTKEHCPFAQKIFASLRETYLR